MTWTMIWLCMHYNSNLISYVFMFFFCVLSFKLCVSLICLKYLAKFSLLVIHSYLKTFRFKLVFILLSWFAPNYRHLLFVLLFRILPRRIPWKQMLPMQLEVARIIIWQSIELPSPRSIFGNLFTNIDQCRYTLKKKLNNTN